MDEMTEKKKYHTIHIRKLEHDVYETMWNLKKALKARSWADMMKKICKAWKEEIEEFEWL